MIIGVDESGLGAWAGPYTVAAVATRHREAAVLCASGVTDSKNLSDKARRAMMDLITDTVLCACVEVVEVPVITELGYANSWSTAVRQAILHVLKHTTLKKGEDVDVIIDGNKTGGVEQHVGHLCSVWSLPRADAAVPAVGAASILAKTVRNDTMIALSLKFPEYGWEKNAGYGVPQHIKALEQWGSCPQHRAIKPILGFRRRSM